MIIHDILTDMYACVEFLCTNVVVELSDTAGLIDHNYDLSTLRYSKERINILRARVQCLFKLNESLKMKSDGIKTKLGKSFSAINQQNTDFRNTIREHAMWIEKCCSIFYDINLEINIAIISLDSNVVKTAAEHLKKAITKFREKESILTQTNKRKESCLTLLHVYENKLNQE